MANTTKVQWTPQEEEIISFFMDLIPILQEVKVDLESKNLLSKEIFNQAAAPQPQPLTT
jgi:hypothetical protein